MRHSHTSADNEEIGRYQIQPGTSLHLTEAAGGTKGINDVIKVFAEGTVPTGLAGSISMITGSAARAHPTLGGQSLCVTLTEPIPVPVP